MTVHIACGQGPSTMTNSNVVRRSPKILRGLALAAVLLVTATSRSVALETVVVVLDQAKVVRLAPGAQTIIVGNPGIADVTVQKNGVLIVTGKSYGVTNFIALDGEGKTLTESLIRVQAATESVVTVQRGNHRESYSCAPQCQPSLALGDVTNHFNEVSGQTGQRNSFAAGTK